MSLYEKFIRPLAFKFEPEWIHERVMGLLKAGLVPSLRFRDSRLEQTLFGVHFANPLGLAAGFDKNAVAVNHWHKLGFGFVEVGTITAHAQPGNPKPRLFRLPQDQGLINRLGFNNHGSEVVVRRLRDARAQIPVGINVGKSKITPVEGAARDYGLSYTRLHQLGSYFVINVSSPNTPGLRTLQEKGALLEIIQEIQSVDKGRPLFVKVAPDLELSALDDVIRVVQDQSVTGIIATNTTIARDGLAFDPGEAGGLSGQPLRAKSNEILSHLYQNCSKGVILMGVGGIFTGADVYEKIRLGAHLTQVYTGWVYGGPEMVSRSLRELINLMNQDGVQTLAELRGSAIKHG